MTRTLMASGANSQQFYFTVTTPKLRPELTAVLLALPVIFTDFPHFQLQRRLGRVLHGIHGRQL